MQAVCGAGRRVGGLPRPGGADVEVVADGQETACHAGGARGACGAACGGRSGAFGYHGGAQRDVQRIPMAFYAPGIKHLVRGTPLRLVGIMPTILRTMGIARMAPMDGTAYNLPMK